MGFLRMTLWSFVCVAIGVFISTFEMGGKTPLQHAQSAWETESPRALSNIQSGFESAMDKAKHTVGTEESPSERHSDEDRAAVNKLIGKSEKLTKK